MKKIEGFQMKHNLSFLISICHLPFSAFEDFLVQICISKGELNLESFVSFLSQLSEFFVCKWNC